MMDHPVILFDGVCNFCNSAVIFIIKRDKKKIFRFAALQSAAGEQLQQQYGFKTITPDSFILIHNGHAYTKTTAILIFYPMLGGARFLLKAGWIVPRFIRDFFYDLFARNRYRWFGKRDACMIPSPETRAVFLS